MLIYTIYNLMLILVDLFLDPVLGSFLDGFGQLDASQLVSSSSSSARGSHPGDCSTGLTVIFEYQLTPLINILKFSIWVLRGVLISSAVSFTGLWILFPRFEKYVPPWADTASPKWNSPPNIDMLPS